ncbi:4-hydroxy-3-methylbut-2-enyl diphosphate reductase [Spiribacter vilamensis]|uniref:4-hydroxy-3-methylbut-2-enyl diphosphate reductase n=1 Tax=Spiribacter vilamensis TaxID=531306 RepID=A0A4Q8CYH3_9GAMM|nr:4-hydroxy-3-methylbut-2-enyl diphosphate reductase [Spiribacter vilamensis]RZU97940.1 4-hydroxy-3-methylbut-2-enyl diphosphate reductase [Spiribacter vilamensis]TVO61147.1 4-hydroxy-3-methylbut-2-enyl diphosphate reductase [Spiribacter vilamensis]
MQEIRVANPRGFCAGVDRAISIVEQALEAFGRPIYVRHEVVHNRLVVDDLRDKGAVFVEELDGVPAGATLIFSAHGVSQSVRDEAVERGLHVFDATCPLVTKVHMEVRKHARQGREVILIGHDGHPEVEGTIGQYVGERADQGGIYLVETPADAQALSVRNPDDLAFVTQTTLSMDDTASVIEALQARFPSIEAPRKDDICYATQNRQDAVRELAGEVDVMIIVGSTNSSNTRRLTELSERLGVPAHQIDRAEELEADWIADASRIGVTAGASAPESLVQAVIDRLVEWGVQRPDTSGNYTEDVVFSMPRDLMRAIPKRGEIKTVAD